MSHGSTSRFWKARQLSGSDAIDIGLSMQFIPTFPLPGTARCREQLLLGLRVKLLRVNLGRAQTVVAQYRAGCIGIDQNPNDRDALFALLGSKTLQVNIEFVHTRGERLTIMPDGVEKLFLTHVLVCAPRSSLFAALHWGEKCH